MLIDIRSGNSRLPRAQALGLADRIRDAFAAIAHRILRVLVRMGEAARPGGPARDCVVEIHLPNGEVMFVHERQRKLGVLLRRVTERAWRAAAAALAGRRESRVPPPCAPRRGAL